MNSDDITKSQASIISDALGPRARGSRRIVRPGTVPRRRSPLRARHSAEL